VSRTRHTRTPKARRAPRTGKIAVPYDTAMKLFLVLKERLQNAIGRIFPIIFAGSLRRKAAKVGDLDVLLVGAPLSGWRALEHLRGLTLDAYGPVKASGWFHSHGKRIRVDLRNVALDSVGAALEYFTGPVGHNLGMRRKAKNAGYRLNEYGLFRVSDGVKVAGDTEQSIYDALHRPWKPPELRGK